MRKYVFYFVTLLTLLFTFLSCNPDTAEEHSIQEELQPNSENSPVKESEENSPEPNESFVTLLNISDFTVWVYADPTLTERIGVIQKDKMITLSSEPSDTGTVYYLSYRVNIGVEIPWSDVTSFVVASPKKNKTVTVSIENPSSMRTSDAFLIVKNRNTDGIIVKQGASTELFALEKSSSILNAGESGVYRIPRSSLASFSILKIISAQGQDIPFSENFTSLASGNVYSIEVNEDSSFLKSASPFDINTQKQIWSFSDTDFLNDGTSRTLMRESIDKQSFLIAGTLRPEQTNSREPVFVGIKKIDFYSEQGTIPNASFPHSSDISLKRTRVIDFVECSDGSTAMLLENFFIKNADEERAHLLVRYNFSTNTLLWSHVFSGKTIFRLDTKNTITRTETDEILVAGALLDTDGMHLFAQMFNETGKAESTFISEEASDYWNGREESMFTSAFYSGSDFYLCGYENCDFRYTANNHSGIVIKLSKDFSSCEKIYENEKCIFTCIDGSNNDFFICGEITESGNLQKGCFISSTMIQASTEPVTVKMQLPYYWFNQLCFYNDMVVLCGSSSQEQAGTQNSMPIVLAFDKSANLLWKNTSLGQNANALSIIPNKIGTYIIQLDKGTSKPLLYSSANLLGEI